jgi:hypothetical protein
MATSPLRRIFILSQYPCFGAIHTVEFAHSGLEWDFLSKFGNVFACEAALITENFPDINPRDIDHFMWVHLHAGGLKFSFQKEFPSRKAAEESAQDRAALFKALYDPHFIERA